MLTSQISPMTLTITVDVATEIMFTSITQHNTAETFSYHIIPMFCTNLDRNTIPISWGLWYFFLTKDARHGRPNVVLSQSSMEMVLVLCCYYLAIQKIDAP